MSVPFAILVLEREPLTFDDLPKLLTSWVQDAGGFAAAGLLIWLVAALIQRPSEIVRKGRPLWLRAIVTTGCAGAALSYGLFGLITLPELLFSLGGPATGKSAASSYASLASPAQELLLTVGGACALVVVLLPFLRDLARWRWRRIWAIALLSAKEVYRKKIYLVFCALLVLFLFADWFLPHKPENQLRNYVQVIYLTISVLLVLTMAVLASFSISSDISNQTIHTIVTKPVERFEIVLGRFLGYVLLMSATLAVMAGASLLFVTFHGVHPDSEAESYTARVPLYGDLQFLGPKADFKGESVGREWEYRKFIAGGPSSPHRAVWAFRALPTRLDERGDVPCEFAFDIFRTRRADREGQGVSCTFTFVTRTWSPGLQDEYQRARRKLEERKPPPSEAEVAEQLASQFGYYEFRSKEITDYHTQSFRVPAGIFKSAQKAADKADGNPVLWVVVKCETPSQFIGVAKRDLYLLDAQGYFGINFFKGTAGLWFWLVLIIGLSVTCSTYLSGVISLMCALFLFVLGLFREFIQSLAAGQTEGGGPAESFLRLVNRQNLVEDIGQTPTAYVATTSDEVFRWFLRRFLNVVPDVNFFDLTSYVAEGFDIPVADLTLHALVLFGYLLPWAILAYYLMKSREVAS